MIGIAVEIIVALCVLAIVPVILLRNDAAKALQYSAHSRLRRVRLLFGDGPVISRCERDGLLKHPLENRQSIPGRGSESRNQPDE